MKSSLPRASTLLAALASAATLSGAVNFTGTYSQNFDSLGTGAVAWTNNSTLPGWHLHQSATNGAPGTLNAPLAAGSGTGTNSKGFWFNFGSGSDRALGGSPAGGTGTLTYGVALTNSTGATITQFDLSFDWERWFDADISVDQTLTFAYSLDATSLTSGTFTSVSSASVTYSAPQGSQLWAASPLVASRSITVTGIEWAPGATLWLRWQDVNEGGGDHGVGIDNVSLTAIPEPSSAALLFSGFAAAAVALRRRRA
jgi:hypothetical protein